MAGGEGIILQLPGEIAEAIEPMFEIIARAGAGPGQLDAVQSTLAATKLASRSE